MKPRLLALILLLAVLSSAARTAEAFVVARSTLAVTTTEATPRTKQKPTSVRPNARTTSSAAPLYGFWGNLLDSFNKNQKGSREPAAVLLKPVYENVVIDQDFRVAALFLGSGFALDWVPYVQWTLGAFTTALGLLFLVQTVRIRFVFDEDNCMELKTVKASSELADSGENPVVGGMNRWSCDRIVNYDFFPQSWMDPDHPIGPVLIYFKETQTDESFWNDGPGKSANDPAKIAAGTAVAGQVHFFPTVCNAQQFQKELEKRGCGKLVVKG